MSAITLDGFEAKFSADPDPWDTFTARDEAIKRNAILRGVGQHARILELACGNGSNSIGLARRALRLTATDGALSAVSLTRARLGPSSDVRLAQLPEDVPRGPFGAVVIAEVLYYLGVEEIMKLGRRLVCEVAPSGVIVLAHHNVDFADTRSRPASCHARLLAGLGARNPSRPQTLDRTRRWRVERVRLDSSPATTPPQSRGG